MLETYVVEKNKTHILVSVPFFENCAVYEIMWQILPSRAGHRWQHGACACMLDN